jgi:hypothetical protein
MSEVACGESCEPSRLDDRRDLQARAPSVEPLADGVLDREGRCGGGDGILRRRAAAEPDES